MNIPIEIIMILTPIFYYIGRKILILISFGYYRPDPDPEFKYFYESLEVTLIILLGLFSTILPIFGIFILLNN